MAERSKFDTVAEQYSAGRPDYPAELYDTLETLLERPLAGAHAVDLGAGTGIASRQLAVRGARVTAIELSRPMIARLAADSSHLAGLSPVQGSATAIPLRDSCADLVTSAQAWHWIDPALGIPEFLRVLRPGGVFGAWWNRTLRELEWEKAQEARIDAACTSRSQVYAMPDDFDERYGMTIAEYDFAWERRVTVDRHLENLASRSYVAALPDPVAFIATERVILSEAFPDGELTERFATDLLAVRIPAGAAAA